MTVSNPPTDPHADADETRADNEHEWTADLAGNDDITFNDTEATA